MVLLPGCACCGCDTPFTAFGNPVSVEADIVGSAFSGSITGTYSGIPYTATLSVADPTGSYSMSQDGATNWSYSGSSANVIFTRYGIGNTVNARLCVRPAATLTFDWNGNTYQTTSYAGVGINRECNTPTQVAQYLNELCYLNSLGSISNGEIVAGSCAFGSNDPSGWFGGNHCCVFMKSGSFSLSLSSGCQIPAVLTYGIGVITWALGSVSSSTFTNNEYPDFTRHWNSRTINVNACRLVYASQTVPFFGDIGQTSC